MKGVIVVDQIYIAAFILLGLGSILALTAAKRPRVSAILGLIGLVGGLGCAGYGAVFNPIYGVSVFFQLPIVLIGIAGGIFAIDYLKGHHEHLNAFYWFFYNLTCAAMLAVTLSTSKLAFLVSWEVMGLASFALVAFDYKVKSTVKAAWIYLLACEAGALFLIPMFIYANYPMAAFILALLGFGLKIGFPVLHIWLPEAHPAAPAPVSALMSGAMIQLGFFGILRWGNNVDAKTFGMTVFVIGCIAALGGILFALSKTNLKTLLAYSSIENMGVIAMGLGIGYLCQGVGFTFGAACGMGGAFLHMLNHAALKGGLFLGAGAVQKAMDSLEVDTMGGLLKKMPFSGTIFLTNAVGLSGLPPFSAFVSEFLIYISAIYAISTGKTILILPGVITLIVLSLVGALATAVYTKAIGSVFLGEARTPKAKDVRQAPPFMKAGLAILYIWEITLIVSCPYIFATFVDNFFVDVPLNYVVSILEKVRTFSLASVALFAVFALWRLRKANRVSCTWDCGYAAPDARMQYTGSAFVQPIVDFFRVLLRPNYKVENPSGNFPKDASYSIEVKDPGMRYFWDIIFDKVNKLADKVHKLQSGYLHFYILIMTIALIAMLLWGILLPWSGSLMKGLGL